MPLVVRGGAILQAEIAGIDRPVRKWDLIVVGVVERFRQRVGSRGTGSAPRSAAPGSRAAPSYFVFTLDSILTTLSGPPTTGLNTDANGASDDEMRPQTVQVIDA